MRKEKILGRRKFNEELKEMRRAEIVEAARKVFGRGGFERTTVADICAEAQIAHGTFYHYFKDKMSVLEAVLDEFLGQLYVFLDDWNSQPPTAPEEVSVFLKKGWALIGDVFLENVDLTRIFFQEAYRSGEIFDTRIRSFYDTVSRIFATNLERGIELGGIYPCDTKITAEMIISVMERVFYKFALGEVDEPLETYIRKAAIFIERAIVRKEGRGAVKDFPRSLRALSEEPA